MRARGEGQGWLFLGRFYSSKFLALPVLGDKKVQVVELNIQMIEYLYWDGDGTDS